MIPPHLKCVATLPCEMSSVCRSISLIATLVSGLELRSVRQSTKREFCPVSSQMWQSWIAFCVNTRAAVSTDQSYVTRVTAGNATVPRVQPSLSSRQVRTSSSGLRCVPCQGATRSTDTFITSSPYTCSSGLRCVPCHGATRSTVTFITSSPCEFIRTVLCAMPRCHAFNRHFHHVKSLRVHQDCVVCHATVPRVQPTLSSRQVRASSSGLRCVRTSSTSSAAQNSSESAKFRWSHHRQYTVMLWNTTVHMYSVSYRVAQKLKTRVWLFIDYRLNDLGHCLFILGLLTTSLNIAMCQSSSCIINNFQYLYFCVV